MISNEFQQALANYNREIDLHANATDYDNRGLLKACKLQDIYGGLADFDRAIQLDPDHASAYVNRGLLKNELLDDRSGGITDMEQAAKLYQQQGDIEHYQIVIDLIKEL
jgi:tetratricopeptide (TPR) repeat protein